MKRSYFFKIRPEDEIVVKLFSIPNIKNQYTTNNWRLE